MREYKGIEYIVYYFSKMEHFNGYVKLPDNHPYQKYINKKRKVFSRMLEVGYNKMQDINCHGGLTFSRKITKKNQKDYPQGFSLGSWIGWDYGHYGDYSCIGGMELKGHKWTEKEVEKECKNVIRQLSKIKKQRSIK